MRHEEYVKACQRTEHRDEPARVRNLKTGEVGEVQQCYGKENPESLLVKTGGKLTTWYPEDVADISDER